MSVGLVGLDPTARIAIACGSSDGRAISDDALKDRHVAGWLFELEASERDRWLERFGWIRRIDRLAEAAAKDPAEMGFARFLEGWAQLRAGVGVDYAHPLRPMLASMDRVSADEKGALDRYVEATRRYHGSTALLQTIAEHEQMLRELSGSILLSMPDAPSSDLHGEVVMLGAVDQLYNDVRDVVEDVVAGLCRFPNEMLARFRISRTDFLAREFGRVGARSLFRFIVDDVGPRMRRSCSRLRRSRLTSATWQRLVVEFDRRHDFFESVVRASDYYARKFTLGYWQVVGGLHDERERMA